MMPPVVSEYFQIEKLADNQDEPDRLRTPGILKELNKNMALMISLNWSGFRSDKWS